MTFLLDIVRLLAAVALIVMFFMGAEASALVFILMGIVAVGLIWSFWRATTGRE